MSPDAAHLQTTLTVRPERHGFGAEVRGLDLSTELTPTLIAELRALWLEHQILYFPEQPLSHAALLRFAAGFGDFGENPYVESVAGQPHILEVRREPDETVSPFGASWHSDWSFQQSPPSATLLHAKIVPPVGGETLFADSYRAFESLDATLREDIMHLRALHSARRPYSHEGYARSGGNQRSMNIVPGDDAWATRSHPIIRTHPETGRQALWINPVYTIAIENMSHARSEALLNRLLI